jgi:anthranilate synthase
MNTNNYCYTTEGGICVSRTITKVSIETTMTEILSHLDSYRGGLFTSSYEYPGRYKRWGIGFVNPPLELATCGYTFTLTALNERGIVLVSHLAERLYEHPQLQSVVVKQRCITGSVQRIKRLFSEQEWSKQPSVFSIVREILRIFHSQ